MRIRSFFIAAIAAPLRNRLSRTVGRVQRLMALLAAGRLPDRLIRIFDSASRECQ
jgi:hypothetical protein